MHIKAGDLFKCVCCLEEHDAHKASFDEALGGPVCDQCRRYFIKAGAWLKHCAGVTRQLERSDIDENRVDYKRFLQ